MTQVGRTFSRRVARRVRALGNPIAEARTRRQLARDRALAASTGWPRVLYIAGLPKSGTTWLEQLLSEVPGYTKRPFRDSDSCTRDHNICDEVFTSLPDDLLSVLKLHTTATATNRETIERHVERAVVMHRDLRDQCVSRYHHARNRIDHPHHQLYLESSPVDGMRHCIGVTLETYVPWVRGWMEVLARDDRYLGVRYEELHADPVGTLARVLRHYGIELPTKEIDAIVERVRAATRFELTPETLAAGSTARKGAVGDWRTHFTPEHVEQFKEGAGDLLVELGYEPDLNWGL